MPECLRAYLVAHAPVVVALSGGTDSAVLLAAATKAGATVAAVTVETGLAPPGEAGQAAEVAAALGVPHTLLHVDMLAIEAVRFNAPERCYLCKRRMMEEVAGWARAHDYASVADGTHAGDDPGERPGVRALRELGVVSPFAACEMGKEEIVALARAWGIPVRPSSSCLATRLPEGAEVTPAALRQVAAAEAILREEVPGRVRVRVVGRSARIEVPAGFEERARALVPRIKALGFEEVIIGDE
ncbi:ATP-dependent sacrificial sulfur transferase LarE [Methanofollis tationis]|uniref:ATP-dependent sacrificial sulfur transferase LarE n=2 Tax=Methanofollis tationis TaxID=81417 RepID=A0A7K4HM97_9EURY|nr:ATP-dependent sacrificial sulfur transferase LarE [Methanofollis tationis]